jgi:hypothetical protein
MNGIRMDTTSHTDGATMHMINHDDTALSIESHDEPPDICVTALGAPDSVYRRHGPKSSPNSNVQGSSRRGKP